MERAAKILRQQISHRNHVWLKSAKTTLGDRVSNFVKDVENIERNGKKRGTTWAEGKSKAEKRRAKVSMGSQLALSD